MSLPKANYCILCEAMRPEVGGKATILGFYGVAPNIDVLVEQHSLPMALCFVVGFPALQPGSKTRQYEYLFVVRDPNHKIVFGSQKTGITLNPSGPAIFALNCAFASTESGTYTLELTIDNELAHKASIQIRLPTLEERQRIGIPMHQ